MLSNIDPRLAASILDRAQTLTTLLAVFTPTGDTLAFTRFPQDITFNGITYRSVAGMELTAVEQALGLSTDNLQAVGVYNDAILSEASVLGGRLDWSDYSLYLIDYAHPEYGAKTIQRGRIRELRSQDYTFAVELASLSQLAQQQIGEITSPTCRNQFADANCQGVEKLTDPALNHPTLGRPMTEVGKAVVSVTSRVRIAVNTTAPDGFYTAGRVTFTSGKNAGLSMDINTHTISADATNGEIRLEEPMPDTIAAGDTLTIRAGCNKTFAACLAYKNVVNMKAEPYLRGARAGLAQQ